MMLTGVPYRANASSLPKATQLLSSRAGKMEAVTPSQRLPDYTPLHTPSRPGLAPLSSACGTQPPRGLGPSHLALCRPLRSPDPHHHPLCSISVVPSLAPPFYSPLASLSITCLAFLLQEAPFQLFQTLRRLGPLPVLQLAHTSQAHQALWKPAAWSGGTRTQFSIPCGLSPDHPSRGASCTPGAHFPLLSPLTDS